MQTIIPHLWYDTQAKEAIAVYTSLFEDSEVKWRHQLTGKSAETVDVISFRLANLELLAIGAKSTAKLNESLSLLVTVNNRTELEALYQELSQGGRLLLPLDSYDFSPYYVWLEDRFGLSWQLSLDENQTTKYHLAICFLFSQEQVGLAEPFLKKYQALFQKASIEAVSYYKEGEMPNPAAKVRSGKLTIDDQSLVVMDHGYGGESCFTEAFSLIVYVDSQKESDAYYEALSHVPEAESCGWVEDEFGLSWQIVPRLLLEAYADRDEKSLSAINTKLLTKKRLDTKAIKDLLDDKALQ